MRATAAGFFGIACMALAGNASAQDEIVIQPNVLIEAVVEGMPAQISVRSGGPDRLLLNNDFVTLHGIQPAMFAGDALLRLAGKREFIGKNRPLDYVIGGVARKGRAFWFPDAPSVAGSGTIGPWAMRQSRVTFLIDSTKPAEDEGIVTEFPLLGGINNSSITDFHDKNFGMAIGFDLDDTEAFPVASAAAGAAIAKDYGGTLSGASWDVTILMGIRRPVRLMTLTKPLIIGPLSFTKIAVRVRDRIDQTGRGEAIPEANEEEQDPSEIIVIARSKKARKPIFSFVIPRAQLSACSRLTFDKRAKVIQLICQPAALPG